MITSILLDLGDTLIRLNKPVEEVMKARVHALHETLLNRGLDVSYGELSEIYRAVHSELSLFSEETGIETTTTRILGEVLARLSLVNVNQSLEGLVRRFFEPEVRSWFLFDDTLSALSSLKDQDFNLGVVSNARSHWAVLEIMRRLKIDRFFGTIVTSARLGLRKPRPEIYLKAMRDLGSDPGSTIMVGNSLETDVIGAKRLKTRTLYLEREMSGHRIVEPDATIKSLSEIPRVVREWIRP